MIPCRCCGFRTLEGNLGFEICPVCCWQDDGQDVRPADLVRGGPSNQLSLSEARRTFAEIGASDLIWVGMVRPPSPTELWGCLIRLQLTLEAEFGYSLGLAQSCAGC